MTFVRNWSKRVASLAPAVVCAMFCSLSAHASELMSEADAIVTVEVAFVPYGDMVLIGQVLYGEMIELSSTTELLGPCLPNKARVRELADNARGAIQPEVYRESIERAGYKAVVFLKRDGSAGRVLCDEDDFLTSNWESDPRYPEWRARLQAALDARSN